MKTYGRIGQIVCAVIAMVIFLLMPFVTFRFVVPLYGLSGARIARTFNELAYIPVGLMSVMIVAAIIGNPIFTMVSSGISLIALILGVSLAGDILLSGNFNELYLCIKFIADRIPQVSEAAQTTDIKQILKIVFDVTMRPGLGFVIVTILHVVYFAFSFVGNKATGSSKKYASFDRNANNGSGKSVQQAPHSNPKAF